MGNGISTLGIILISVGAAAFVGLILVVVFWVMWDKKRKQLRLPTSKQISEVLKQHKGDTKKK